VLLTAQQQQAVARKASWYFDCYFGALYGDAVTFTGDGVGDLDKLISRLEDNALNNHESKQRFQCDVGGQYSDWRNFDLDDVYAIRAYFVGYYGDVNKPDVYASGSNTAFPVAVAEEFRGSGPQMAIE